MRVVLTLALTVCGAFAAPALIRDVNSECPETASVPICKVRRGWSFKFDTMVNRVPLAFGPDGRSRFPLSFRLPGAEVSYADDVAPDTDGSFVAAATAVAADLRHWQKSGLVMFDPSGLQTAFIDTGDFHGTRVAIAPDRSIWVLGSQFSRVSQQEHYAILRKYSRSGELLGSFLDRATFPPGLEPGSPSSGVALFAVKDRIAVMAFSGKVGNERELIELDPEGNVLGRMRFDNALYHFYAFTETGSFYAGPSGPAAAILQLDPVTGAQREVESPGRPWTLIGADGPNLLYRSVTPDGHLRIGWFPQP